MLSYLAAGQHRTIGLGHGQRVVAGQSGSVGSHRPKHVK